MLDVKSDLKFGLEREEGILKIIKKHFNDETIKNTKDLYDEFCIYDYENKDGITWEVKSRRNRKQQYPTTILPVHKVRDVETKQYFIFNFTDKPCYIEYDKEVFNTFTKSYINANRSSGSNNNGRHYEIPISYLKDFPITN
jgi:hypothetical protein